jgi:hypothetical protein
MLVEMPWFDAIAPYHPTATGIFSDLGRRPKDERTMRNGNIAVIYSTFTSLNALLPQCKSRWLDMMESAGLDPDNTKEDPTAPSGIGILAAKNAWRRGRMTVPTGKAIWVAVSTTGSPTPTTRGYKPVNSADELRNPSRRQPNVASTNNVHKVQQFATVVKAGSGPVRISRPQLRPRTSTRRRSAT